MKKIFGIFTALMIIALPLCFTGCGNNNIVKDWTEVQYFGTQCSKIYFSYTTEYCTAEEFNSAQHKLYASDSDKYYEWNFNSNKKTSIEKAQERISNRIYYYNSLSSSGYYKITYNGFYTDIIQIKMYNNNYIEYRHVYKDYGIVNVEHHSPIIGTLNDTYSITYFE